MVSHAGWFKGFTSRNPELSIRIPETLSAARRRVCEQQIRQWFASVEHYLTERQLQAILDDASRIFNLDESGFQMNPESRRVLGIKTSKNWFVEASGQEKKQLTVLTTVGADGSIPPPMVIYPRKRLNGVDVKVPDEFDFVPGKSDKGWISFETLYEYLANGFNDWLTAQEIVRPVIIFTDWHETRANYFLAQKLTELGIILIGLLPNTTHILQPLDVGVFGPLKGAWSRHAANWKRANPAGDITPLNFAPIFIPFLYDRIKRANIVAGFRATGIFPFDSDAPDYSKLRSTEEQDSIPTPFVGVNIGGKTEAVTQTDRTMNITRHQQADRAALILDEDLDVAYPAFRGPYAQDDIIIGPKKYVFLRRDITHRDPIVIGYPSRPQSKLYNLEVSSFSDCG